MPDPSDAFPTRRSIGFHEVVCRLALFVVFELRNALPVEPGGRRFLPRPVYPRLIIERGVFRLFQQAAVYCPILPVPAGESMNEPGLQL